MAQMRAEHPLVRPYGARPLDLFGCKHVLLFRTSEEGTGRCFRDHQGCHCHHLHRFQRRQDAGLPPLAFRAQEQYPGRALRVQQPCSRQRAKAWVGTRREPQCRQTSIKPCRRCCHLSGSMRLARHPSGCGMHRMTSRSIILQP